MRVADEELRKARDAQMVRQTLAGNTNAFSVLYDQYKDILIFSVCNEINNWHDAQDIAHDAFLKAFEHLEELRKLEQFSVWLFRIATQLIIDRQREKSRGIEAVSLSSRSSDDVVLDLEQAAMLAHRLAEEFTEREEQKAELFETIAKLPDSQRQVLLLQMEEKIHSGILNDSSQIHFLVLKPYPICAHRSSCLSHQFKMIR